MESSIRLIRIAGIDIGVHASWLLIFLLVTWSLASGFLPTNFPEFSRAMYWILGAIAAVLLFVSVLVHELSHSLVAQARGMRVHSITLFLFGGVSNILGESESAGDEFKIAFVGPLTSLGLAALFFGLAAALEGVSRPLFAILTYLWGINLGLAVFNLIPGFPLDGGRVFRAIVWAATGNRSRATNVASTVGIVCAYLFMLGGLILAFTGNLVGGLWIAFIGWFLSNAAAESRQRVVQEEQFGGVLVGDVMKRNPETVSPEESLIQAIHDHILPRSTPAVPVIDHGALVGILTLNDIRHVPQDEWPFQTVRAVMGGRDGVRTVTPNIPLAQALERLADGDLNQMPVVENGQLVGMLSRSDIVRWLQVRQALRLDGEGRHRAREKLSSRIGR